ncbi:MAG: outer membrane beta-barrel protein [Bacteroidales bacterium]|nr:outer membrane beta-barrel protein [Bacteroidales bacterium]
MNIKAIVILSIIFTIPIIAFTQRGYYIQDNTKNVNIKILKINDRDNYRYFRFYKNDSLKYLTPAEVSEYGIDQDKVFVSAEILLNDTIQKVFLEKLVEGPVSLYFFRSAGFKSYYLSRNGGLLTELPRQQKKEGIELDFRDQLSEYMNSCAKVSKVANLVTYNKNSMKRYINSYNICDLKYFLRTRVGVLASFNFTNIKLPKNYTSKYLQQMNFDQIKNISAGIFVDQPLFENVFLLHSELVITKTGFSAFSRNENKDIDFVSNLITLNLPIQIRYLFPLGGFTPFINAGSNIGYNWKNEDAIYETLHTPDQIEINTIPHNQANSDFQLGYAAGAGIDISITGRNSLILECRYTKLYGLEPETLMFSGLQFITSISF